MQRTFVEDEAFSRNKLLVEPCAVRFDEFIEGFQWIIQRDVEYGIHIRGDVRRANYQDPLDPSVLTTIYYCFDDETITLLDIAFITVEVE